MQISKDPLMQSVVARAGEIMGLEPSEILSRSRLRSLVMARHVVLFVLMRSGRYSYAELGAYFFLDHATIIHACNNIRSELKKPKVFERAALESMIDDLSGILGDAAGVVSKELNRHTLRKHRFKVHFIPEHRFKFLATEVAYLKEHGTPFDDGWLIETKKLASVFPTVSEESKDYKYVWLRQEKSSDA